MTKVFKIPEDTKTTYHKFYNDCENDIKQLFDEKCYEICPDGYEPVFDMNELYVTRNKGICSDLVFETPHVDGPFFFIPGVLLRCIYVVQENLSVITKIPKQDFNKSIRNNEFCMFDYHRDIHWIEIGENSENSDRIVLKLHFVQKNHYILKYLSIIYNYYARFLFVKSLNKNVISVCINAITNVYPKILNIYYKMN